MIFQDPISSLNPRRKIKDIVGEGISIWGDKATKGDARARVDQVLLDVGLDPETVGDRRVQAQILNLLEQMKERYQLTLIFIAHDLAVVKNISDRVAVMYLGKMCEIGPAEQLYGEPAHPYTHALLASIPQPDPSIEPLELETLQGELPSPIEPPSGCRFRTRCPRAEERCAEEEPLVREVADRHFVACHFPLVGETAPPEAGIPVRMKASA
jgi:peptide/nickel transport system ATP-binding protein